MPSKLTQAARDDIELQLEAGTRVDVIAHGYRISERQVYRMRKNLEIFGCVAPNPAEMQVHGRPRLITPEAREGVLDFLLENGKLANTDKVQFYLKDEWGIKVGWGTARNVIKDLIMTKKIVSNPTLACHAMPRPRQDQAYVDPQDTARAGGAYPPMAPRILVPA
jgi:transposase